MEKNPTGQNQREMGSSERLLHNVHRFGGLTGVQVMHISGPLSPKTMRNALDWLQSQHPILNAHLKITGLGIAKGMPWVFFRRVFKISGTRPIPLNLIEQAEENDWQTQMQKELSSPISGRHMPLIRATLMRTKDRPDKNVVLLSANHAIADAKAANMMTCQILEYLGNPDKKGKNNPGSGLPPSLEELTPEKSRNSARPYQPAIRIKTPYSHPWQRQTRVLKGSIGKRQTGRINKTLAERKTSIHGLLSASALLFLGEKDDVDELTLLSNVELRRICSPSLEKKTFGCYIDIVRTRHKLNAPLWDLAQKIKFSLISTLARNQAGASQIKMPPWDFYRHEGWATLKSGMRLDAITITSADAAAIKSVYGKIQLDDLTLAVSLGTIGASYFLISMQREGALELNLCYMHPGVKDKEAEQLLQNIIADLNGI